MRIWVAKLNRDMSLLWPHSLISQFLSRVSILTRDIDIAIQSVCLSVRLDGQTDGLNC